MDLPTLNTFFNLCALILMCAAFAAIKANNRDLHKRLMLGAVVASTAFLVSYLIYHFGYDAKKYGGSIPYVYYSILISHVLLAALVPFAVIYVVIKGLKGQYASHKKVARWTLPIWAYVSVTGVVVYVMVHL